MPTQKRRITIIGAGIAGMATAIGLARQGLSVTLLEKTPRPKEVGAGLQLSPNVTKILKEWELLELCQEIGVSVEALNLHDGYSGKTLLSLPLKQAIEETWQVPYLTIHRADLQAILIKAVEQHPLIKFFKGVLVQKISTRQNHIYLTIRRSDNVSIEECDYLICADGVWSKTRQQFRKEISKFTGYIAWRLTLPKEHLPNFFKERKSISAWCGRGAHIISYPIKQGKLYNFVAITPGNHKSRDPDKWQYQGNTLLLKNGFHNWNEGITTLTDYADEWTYWPLFVMPSICLNHNPQIYFVGDAAHALLPFAAQGAAMALEDSYILSGLFAKYSNAESLAERYQALRYARLVNVEKRTNFNRWVYHQGGLGALARNLFFKLAPNKKFLNNLNWLYNYNAKNDIEKA